MQRCSACGAELAAGTLICPQCGQTRTASGPVAVTGSTVPSPVPGAELANPAGPPPSITPPPPSGPSGWPYVPPPSAMLSGPYLPFPPPSPMGPTRPKSRAGLLVAALISGLVLMLVVAPVVCLATFLYLGARSEASLDQPTINVESKYSVGSTPAAATGTQLYVSGQHFAPSAKVNFALDGQVLAGSSSQGTSNNQGGLAVYLSVSNLWPLGSHQLTAIDTSTNKKTAGVTVVIVPQGQAHTPGPHGAPPDDADFQLNVQIRGKDSNGQMISSSLQLVVTGQPDPAGGTVCASDDDQLAHTYDGSVQGVPYHQRWISRCEGTYKQGQIRYTRLMVEDSYVFTKDGTQITCTAQASFVAMTLVGSFTSSQGASGDYQSPYTPLQCDHGATDYLPSATGTWTAVLAS
ncbi:MAG: hypothetical protein IRZ31_08815 [Thermogemmatispora sp.]|uniref:zinc ribbon domain-containing protein n=1 Tax=Thermogemmatispora sp. TaxID=1968838 RepID=UPI002614F7E1|nr:zinc ribbon domain-containing protein [Thermogemmatispora sp.]MBX5456989.1 hypothetical protein [Thermogemmatispora sp.]